MMSLTHRRLAPIARLILLSGLLLTSLSLLLDVTAPIKSRALNASSKIYALVDVGKGMKSEAHEQYREDMREGFSIDEHAWIVLRFSPAANLRVVRTQKDTQAWLRKSLHADYVGETDILRVWLTDGSLQEQAAIIDTIIRDFLQYIERDRIPFLKLDIATARRDISACLQVLDSAETELLKLNNVVPANMDEMESIWLQRKSLEELIAAEKKAITSDRYIIERDEAALHTLPRIIKWAGKPRPEE